MVEEFQAHDGGCKGSVVPLVEYPCLELAQVDGRGLHGGFGDYVRRRREGDEHVGFAGLHHEGHPVEEGVVVGKVREVDVFVVLELQREVVRVARHPGYAVADHLNAVSVAFSLRQLNIYGVGVIEHQVHVPVLVAHPSFLSFLYSR